MLNYQRVSTISTGLNLDEFYVGNHHHFTCFEIPVFFPLIQGLLGAPRSIFDEETGLKDEVCIPIDLREAQMAIANPLFVDSTFPLNLNPSKGDVCIAVFDYKRMSLVATIRFADGWLDLVLTGAPCLHGG
jgi:hypothetical protein